MAEEEKEILETEEQEIVETPVQPTGTLVLDIHYVPSAVNVIDFEKNKALLAQTLEKYKGVVINKDTYADAKSELAKLRKLKKSLNDRRIEVKNDYMNPFKKAEEEVKELTKMLDDVITDLDSQTEALDKADLEEKQVAIFELWKNKENHKISLDKVYQKSWDLKNTTLKKIEKEMDEFLERVNNDLASITTLIADTTDCEEIKLFYLDHLDLNAAVQEYSRVKSVRAEAARRAEERAKEEAIINSGITVSEEKEEEEEVAPQPQAQESLANTEEAHLQSITFKVTGTYAELEKLSNFIRDNKIKVEVILDKEDK